MPVMPTAPMPDMSGMDVSALAALQQSAPDLATRQSALEAMKALQGADGGFNTGKAPALFGYDTRAPKETGRAAGGLIRYQQGGLVDMATRVSTDPAVIAMANRMGMSVQEYLSELEPEARRQLVRRAGEQGFISPAESTALEDVPTTLEPVQRGAITGGLPRGPRGFSPLSFDNPLAAERAAAEQPSMTLNAMEQLYADGLVPVTERPPRRRSDATEEPQGYIPPTIGATELNTPAIRRALSSPAGAGLPASLEYGPPRRRSDATEEPRVDVPPVDEFSAAGIAEPAAPRAEPFVDPDLPPYYTLRRMLFPGEDPELAREAMEQRSASRTVEDATPVDEVGPLPEVTYTPPAETPLEYGPPRRRPTPDTTQPAPPQQTPAGPAGTGPTGVPANAQMTDNERMLNQDKWLALARVGLGLMASQAPTFGQALGEAGMAGVEALQSARKDYVERKQAEELMAMRRAAGASRGRGSQFPATGANILNAQIEALNTQLTDPMAAARLTAAERLDLQNQLDDLLLQQRVLQAAYLSQYGLDSALGVSAPRGGSGTVSANISD
jgi:hypothetical protein